MTSKGEHEAKFMFYFEFKFMFYSKFYVVTINVNIVCYSVKVQCYCKVRVQYLVTYLAQVQDELQLIVSTMSLPKWDTLGGGGDNDRWMNNDLYLMTMMTETMIRYKHSSITSSL